MEARLNRTPSLIAATSALSFTFTVLHVFGYFLVMGHQFQPLMTAQDYFATAAALLPLAIGVMLIATAYGGLIMSALVQPFLARRPSLEQHKTWRQVCVTYVPAALIVLGWIGCYFSSCDAAPNIAVYAGFFLFIANYFGSYEEERVFRFLDTFGVVGLSLALALPLVAVFVVGFGGMAACGELRGYGSYTIRTTDELFKDARLSRAMSLGVLFRVHADHETRFVPWSEVKAISRVDPPE